MFNLKDLEKVNKVTKDNFIKCPVKGCNKLVHNTMGKSFKRESEYFCNTHKIYISPSTFEYETDEDNLLINTKEEVSLLNNIKKFKRESRITRERSEDAVTWNVFRFMELNNELQKFLQSKFNDKSNVEDCYFWSVSLKQQRQWKELNEARLEFGETIERGTEPDFVIETETTIYFIESKLTASNNTPGSEDELKEKVLNRKKYETGAKSLFLTLFKENYDSILNAKKYELMRLWLLGNFIAQKKEKRFVLINLVMDKKEKDIETLFGNKINQNENRLFKRITWEEIYGFLKQNPANSSCLDYLKYKSLGYSNGKLAICFNIKD